MPGFDPIGGEPIADGPPHGVSPPPPPPPPLPPEPPGGYCNVNDTLGEPPLGDVSDCSVDPVPPTPIVVDPVPPTVISQYANSPILLEMVNNLIAYFRPGVNFDNFYNQIWNIDTAVGYGLDVWGRIVGVSRVLHIAAVGAFFGYKEATDAEPFNQGVFFSGSDATSNFSLSDSAYRRLILAKALANITDCSIPAINQIIINLFPGYGNCYVTDGLNMTMTYTFHGTLSPVDLAIIQGSGVLPKPAGVSVTVVQI